MRCDCLHEDPIVSWRLLSFGCEGNLVKSTFRDSAIRM
jgi:hypothetical protein